MTVPLRAAVPARRQIEIRGEILDARPAPPARWRSR